jgi:hypothetical protein
VATAPHQHVSECRSSEALRALAFARLALFAAEVEAHDNHGRRSD